MIIIFSSCNEDLSKKCADLEKENKELKNRLKGDDGLGMQMVPFAGEKDLEPMSLSNLRKGVQDLYSAAINKRVIRLPLSWRFEETQLRAMLDTFETGGAHQAIGVMAYPIIEGGDRLKIALVPYYEESANVFKHYVSETKNTVGAYNYSSMCPPDNCIKNLSDILDPVILEKIKNSYKFTGSDVDKKD